MGQIQNAKHDSALICNDLITKVEIKREQVLFNPMESLFKLGYYTNRNCR